MSAQRPDFELVSRPSNLRVRTQMAPGEPKELFDEAARSLDRLADVFADWLNAELDIAAALAKRLMTSETPAEETAALNAKAHELRGTCANYRRPDLAQAAKSLFDLTATMGDAPGPKLRALAALHLQTMRALADTKDGANVQRQVLLDELERAATCLTAAARS